MILHYVPNMHSTNFTRQVRCNYRGSCISGHIISSILDIKQNLILIKAVILFIQIQALVIRSLGHFKPKHHKGSIHSGCLCNGYCFKTLFDIIIKGCALTGNDTSQEVM